MSPIYWRGIVSFYGIAFGIIGLLFTPTSASPQFDANPQFVQFLENTTKGELLFVLTARDSKPQTVMTFSTNDAVTNEYVEIIPLTTVGIATANVTLKNNLDREKNPGGIALTFSVTDTKNTVYKTVRLYILDVCDENPQFEKPAYTLEINENSFNGSNLKMNTSIRATDGDNGENAVVTYAMQPNTESPYWRKKYSETFSINAQTGDVYLLRDLDYEENSFYQYKLFAHDTCNRNATPADLTINVKDVQDMPPFFIGLPYMKNINEGDYSVHPLQLLQVSAFDGDRGIPNEVGYRIIPSIGCSRNKNDDCNFCKSIFQIDNSTGNITVIGNLDWSMSNVTKVFGICTIIVEAEEKDTHPENQRGKTNSNTTVTITIVDTNNHAPNFTLKSYNASIEENAIKDTLVLLYGGAAGIEVSDVDQGSNSNFNVTLGCNNQPNCDTFEVVPSTIVHQGVITIRVNNNSLLDYEQSTSIIITLYATEETDKSHNDTTTVTIQIINVNEFSPKFTNKTYEVSIPEEPLNGTSVINITATDSDHGNLGVVSYSLAGGNNLFAVNNITGKIVTNCTAKDLDREKLQKLYLSIFATDGGGLISQAQLIVNLADKNDNPPKFQQDGYIAFLEENSTDYVKKSFLTVKATDEDIGENKQVSYEIGNITALEKNFTIGNKNGELRLLSPLDYEALNDSLKGVINVTVFAHDHGMVPLISNITVTITVQDMNDNTPQFEPDLYHRTIRENATAGTIVGTVSATDADKTLRNHQISFAIAEGGFDNFRINSSTGVVSVQTGARFDRDQISLYNLTIMAIDQGADPKSAITTMSVTIVDINNKPPYFKNNSYSVDILEDRDDKSSIIICDAFDPDENFSLSYSIISIKGWDENREQVNSSLIKMYFRIDETGAVYVNSKLDRETVETMEMVLSVKDTKADIYHLPQTATVTLTVTLMDVNDNDPFFIFVGNANHYETRVSENAVNPTILMSVLAKDTDKNRTINYSISKSTLCTNANESAFEIDATTGVLSKIGEVDRESTQTVNITITATDSGYPSRFHETTVLITILDFNDNTPQFCSHNNTFHVMENASNGTIVAIINATDDDEGRNSKLLYKIEKTEMIPFAINATTGVISVCNALDREGPQGHSFTLTIIARDNPDDSKLIRTNQTTITIELDDINDNPPCFPNLTLKTRTPRDTAANNIIFTVIATDADAKENAKVNFSIANDTNAADYFDIINTGNNEGRVIISQGILNLAGWYNITLIATDCGRPQYNSSKTLYIEVLDVNLNAPEIEDVQGPIKVYECASMNSVIARINATDRDKSSPNNEFQFSMSIIQPQSSTNFKIDKNTGQVFVNANLSVTNISIYEVQIMATDLGTPNRTSSPMIINIVVDDVNDQPPSFKQKDFFFTVPEGQENKTIGQAIATDPDRNSRSCFRVKSIRTDYADYFEIDEDGYIIAKKPLDRENKNQSTITFSVEVRDCSEEVNVSSQCGNYPLEWNSTATANVTINVLDIDDNPPQFTSNVLRIGMRRNTEPKKEILELKPYVTDKDLAQNGKDKWVFEIISLNMTGNLETLLRGQNSGNGYTNMLYVTGNGTVVNNMWYTQDMSGIFNMSVLVKDGAGNSTTYVLIFLIADSQVLKMTLFGNRTSVAFIKDTILSACTTATGKLFVYDNIEDHITDGGKVETDKTDLFFHIAEYENSRVLSADEAKRFLDEHADDLYSARFSHGIISIESSLKSSLPESESTKTTYVMAAVIGLLGLVILIVGYMFFSSTNRFKRKLRAAMPTEKEMKIMKKEDFAVPGCNKYANRENPLLKAELAPPLYDEIDDTSHNSLDENEVDNTKREILTGELEEREATLDMYGEDNYPLTTIDPLEAALREHDAQMQAAMPKQDVSNVHVNHGFLHDLELETTEI